ncbi:MAG: hypothetical protein ACRCYU_05185 [Nocardioides sp.]
MTQPHDDDWRSIVENFGEVPDADRIAAEVTPRDASPADDLRSEDPPENLSRGEPHLDSAWSARSGPERLGPENSWSDEGRFVPPTPPPLPWLPWPQRVAWTCLVGGPVAMLALLFSGVRPPAVLMLIGVAAALAGFGYLVFWSPRTPREPWDDGAQV